VSVMNQALTVLGRYRAHGAVIAANVAFAAIFVAIALSLFHQPTPHDVPVGIVAPAPVAHAIASSLDERRPGGFELRSLPSERRARIEIAHRTVDGALVVSPQRLTLLTAGAAGTAPTQAITTAFTKVAAASGRPLTTRDVVPPLSGDSQALSSFFVVLCVLFPSLATGIAAGHALRRSAWGARVGVLLIVAMLVGLGAAGIADAISGLAHYWAIAGIVALFSLAISAPTAAMGQIRPHLVALCVLAFLILGIPISGGPANLAGFAPSFLRWLHSGLPLGVAADAIRNTVYFRSGDTGHLWVLSGYAGGGLVALCLLIAAAGRRNRRSSGLNKRSEAGQRAETATATRANIAAPTLAGASTSAMRS
jgi:hypothetical protein